MVVVERTGLGLVVSGSRWPRVASVVVEGGAVKLGAKEMVEVVGAVVCARFPGSVRGAGEGEDNGVVVVETTVG